MLKGEIKSVDLIKKQEIFSLVDNEFKPYLIEKNDLKKINFPLLNHPKKIKSISLEKQNIIEEKLVGIKGQYLIFESDYVFNMRKHTGFEVKFSIA